MTQPVQRFKAGGCVASIFANEVARGEESMTLHTVVLQRVYKDSDGTFKYTTSLKANDVPKAILALVKAYDFLLGDRKEEAR